MLSFDSMAYHLLLLSKMFCGPYFPHIGIYHSILQRTEIVCLSTTVHISILLHLEIFFSCIMNLWVFRKVLLFLCHPWGRSCIRFRIMCSLMHRVLCDILFCVQAESSPKGQVVDAKRHLIALLVMRKPANFRSVVCRAKVSAYLKCLLPNLLIIPSPLNSLNGEFMSLIHLEDANWTIDWSEFSVCWLWKVFGDIVCLWFFQLLYAFLIKFLSCTEIRCSSSPCNQDVLFSKESSSPISTYISVLWRIHWVLCWLCEFEIIGRKWHAHEFIARKCRAITSIIPSELPPRTKWCPEWKGLSFFLLFSIRVLPKTAFGTLSWTISWPLAWMHNLRTWDSVFWIRESKSIQKFLNLETDWHLFLQIEVNSIETCV